MYSFSLYPNEYQPSGTANFSQIYDTSFKLLMNKKIKENPVYLYTYARSYNVLRIMSGMGGLSFKNS